MANSIVTFNVVRTNVDSFNTMVARTPAANGYQTNTTLNSKYSILPDTLPVQKPQIRYFGIGVNGFKNLDTGQKMAPYSPDPRNLDLYKPIPLRVVPVTADLSPAVRANYRMRVKKRIGQTDYWCYYLKVLNYKDDEVKIVDVDPATGIETERTGFDPAYLNPVPSVTSSNGTVTYSYETLIKRDADVIITGSEVIEAASLLYNDMMYTQISEIGLYSGEDKQVTVDGVTYIEAVYTQLCLHRCSLSMDLSDAGASFHRTYRLTSTEAALVK